MLLDKIICETIIAHVVPYWLEHCYVSHDSMHISDNKLLLPKNREFHKERITLLLMLGKKGKGKGSQRKETFSFYSVDFCIIWICEQEHPHILHVWLFFYNANIHWCIQELFNFTFLNSKHCALRLISCNLCNILWITY